MNAILSARNDTDQSVKIREIKNRRIIMEVRTAASPRDVKHYTTDRLREEFLIQDLSRQTRSIWYTATLTVLLQEQQFRSMKNWF